ncbi:MAG: hypothetical protein ACREA0_10390, partial [bacterium]
AQTSLGATVNYSPLQSTTLSASLTYIADWSTLDFLALYGFIYGGEPFRGSLKDYLLDYPAVAKLGLGMTHEFTSRLRAFVRAENLGNNLRTENFNLMIPTPRSVIAGVRLRY